MTENDFQSAFRGVATGQAKPSPAARDIAMELLRRDHQRARLLAALSLLFWLLGVSGMLLLVYGLNQFVIFVRIADWNAAGLHSRTAHLTPWDAQMLDGTTLLHHSMPYIAASIISLMIAALFTVLLVLSSRQATLNRINVSLMQLGDQLRQMRAGTSPEASGPELGETLSYYSMPPGRPRRFSPVGLVVLVIFLALLALFVALRQMRAAATERAQAQLQQIRLLSQWRGYRRLAPFTAVRWREQNPQVQVAGKWYELLEINDVPVQQIIQFARSADEANSKKHFEQDMVELMTRMGYPPGNDVTLKVKDLSSGQVRTLEKVAMTEENRRALWQARQASGTSQEDGEDRGENP